MNTMTIIAIVMLLITILAAADMCIFFWRRHRTRRREVSISRHLRHAVEEMGPFPETPDSDMLA